MDVQTTNPLQMYDLFMSVWTKLSKGFIYAMKNYGSGGSVG